MFLSPNESTVVKCKLVIHYPHDYTTKVSVLRPPQKSVCGGGVGGGLFPPPRSEFDDVT